MAPDGHPVPESNAPTPVFSPLSSGVNTPQVATASLQEYRSVPLGKKGVPRTKTYMAGSKALDSLVKMVASTESFFHPSNSGAWTADVSIPSVSHFALANMPKQLSAFLKYVVYEFNKRQCCL